MSAEVDVTGPVDDIHVYNPYSGELVGRAPAAGPTDIGAALARLKTYRHDLDPQDRSRLLRAAADALEAEKSDYARLMTRESGNCLKDSLKEVDRSVANLRVAAEEAVRLNGEALRLGGSKGGKMAMTLHEPVGVVCAITPFNRPLNQVVVKVAPALAANNAVIVKPSEKTPLTALAFAELLHRVGVPETMLAVVVGEPGETGRRLVDSPLTDMITFTGSVTTGEKVAARAGLKKVTMELGGNDPFIVLDDADLDAAAAIAASGALATAGQSCRGIKRILVAEGVADAFAERLTALVRGKRWGDPLDPATEIGGLIDTGAAELAEARWTAAVRDGANLLCGGRRDGTLVAPTVLDHVDPASELVVQETFAPIAPIIRVRDVDHAIAVANGTDYGLQAGVATRDYDAFMRLATELRVGAVNLMEGPNFDSPYIPFGGVKRSGIGREGIAYAMREMTTLKAVVLPWEAGPTA